jgi:hypothetical protein
MQDPEESGRAEMLNVDKKQTQGTGTSTQHWATPPVHVTTYYPISSVSVVAARQLAESISPGGQPSGVTWLDSQVTCLHSGDLRYHHQLNRNLINHPSIWAFVCQDD